uniref:Uncharacterized protein n=1 Tax=viral metagenome TaxID=1070528 RepID=A0A6H2A061_9ZZZZ
MSTAANNTAWTITTTDSTNTDWNVFLVTKPSPLLKCAICNEDIINGKHKHITLTLTCPIPKQLGFIYPENTIKTLDFHFGCYLNHMKKINKLLVIDEMLR